MLTTLPNRFLSDLLSTTTIGLTNARALHQQLSASENNFLTMINNELGEVRAKIWIRIAIGKSFDLAASHFRVA